MESDQYKADYFDGKQKRGVLTLSNEALLRFISRRMATAPAKNRVLEIGCAYGEFTQALGDAYPSVCGVDVSEYAITEGKKRHPHLDLRVVNFEQDPIPQDFKGAFDMIVSLHTFEHFHDPVTALKKTVEALAPGGIFFMIVPNPQIWAGKILKPFGKEKLLPVFGDETHFSLFTQAKWAGLLHDVGLKTEQLGRPFYTLKHPLLDKLFHDRYYTTFLQRSGFELLFVCTKA